ncbi:putative glycine dehydrogenase (decarboxylating), mitochondrial [Neonectria ditissima]|uniref:Glycine cleavage system P protein n=1 Tax=Neonectria ditissima TaxID=78410 RepID=A0A0P7BNI0_9HYPO|nr:putative glycine dehydrogenase (decarboxylating), mitochondrial [Neonectria ditissima]
MASRQIFVRGHGLSAFSPSALKRVVLPTSSLARSSGQTRNGSEIRETPASKGPKPKEYVKKYTERTKNYFNRKLVEPVIPIDPKAWSLFPQRHIGPRDNDIQAMLQTLGPGAETMDKFVGQVVPNNIMQPPLRKIQEKTLTETEAAKRFEDIFKLNPTMKWMNGGGYYDVETPPIIKRNILENPAWYTSYTPYQAEISQGRLESLLNFQTMVSDLTGLPIANASLLDEGTAAAEAMTMSMNSLPSLRAKRPGKTYVVSHLVHAASYRVMQGRAEGFGIKVELMDVSAPDAIQKIKDLGDDLVGVLVQYPDTNGGVNDFRELTNVVHDQGALLSAATDLSALTYLTPPGEWGADIAFGNSQRFGVPLGYGGPHAAFMAVKESIKRRLPGRLVGLSKDRRGSPALRLALQTREQHIRREKATSNVCTAQALLANMAAMYAIYHGPAQLKEMAIASLRYARALQAVARHYDFKVTTATLDLGGKILSDTITIDLGTQIKAKWFCKSLESKGVSIRHNSDKTSVTMAVSPAFNRKTFLTISLLLRRACDKAVVVGDVRAMLADTWKRYLQRNPLRDVPEAVRRKSTYLTHPVFNSHHSETELLRYMHHLQSKDLSLVHSMITLGSCTMKLNATSQMQLISNPKCNVHPQLERGQAPGYSEIFKRLKHQLGNLTGMDRVNIQPNSGAQGEFSGLRVIRKYHESEGNSKRDICLIPVSAHGTNPASAAMAGMRVVSVKCDTATGNLDIVDLEEKCKKHADELAAIMLTYPSTYGVFEPDIQKACQLVHQHGGLVYMDGANMNAQIGLTTPAAVGADICHLNLHKTFCIPHGGGGPGVGPICAKKFLDSFLPHQKDQFQVSSAFFGSASILPISWMYIATMGDEGLRKATETALLNANYMLTRLKDHYPILYTNDKGRCAHEFIVDIRPFQKSAGIEVIDVAKRLQDYGFHSPTMGWPVPNTLMIEPTESESKNEMDRFVDAMISIREEIREVEEGKQPREGNVLKNAPHPQVDLIRGDGDGKWERPYSREKAAYPLPYLVEKKFWPTVARVDDKYGDTHLFCTCPPVEDTTSVQDPASPIQDLTSRTEDTTSSFKDTVSSVQDTVSSVQDTISLAEDAINSAQDSIFPVEDTAQLVKDTTST